jgi:RHS repeat-associated protein
MTPNRNSRDLKIGNRYILFVAFVVSSLTGFSQSVNMQGAPCVGDVVYYFQGNCSDYLWSVTNGTITSGQGTGSIHVTYSSATGTNVTVWATCNSSYNQYSNNFTISSNVTPSVALTLGGSNICRGSNISLTANPTNGGGSPNYSFYVDGSQVYSGSSSSYNYNTASLSPGSHSSYVILTTSLLCVTASSATSSTENFTVTGKTTYTANISGPPQVCSGGSPSVTLVTTVGGSIGNLTYEWFRGGVSQGAPAPSNSFQFTNVSHGEVLYCKAHSTDWCVDTPAQTSNYTVNIVTTTDPDVGIQVSNTTRCSGEVITFTAEGASGTREWRLNGILLSGETGSSVQITTSYAQQNGYFYPGSWVTLNVSGITGTCLSGSTASETTPLDLIEILQIPNVQATPSSQSICNASSMTAIALTNPNSTSGTGYSWTVSAPNISNAGNGSGSSISQSLSQTTNTNQTATYTITPSANGCVGSSIQATVTIKPVPSAAVSSGSQAICSGQQMAAVSLSNPNNVGGTTLSWTISGGATGGSNGSGSSIQQTLSTTNVVNTLTYSVTGSYNGCTGSAVTHVVTVKPVPTAQVSSSSQTFCSGQTMAAVTLTNPNNVSGTTLAWTVSATDISGASNGSGGPIQHTLSHSQNSNRTATYTVTPSADGCSGSTVQHVATVKPIPNIQVSLGSQSVCSDQPMTAVTISNPNGVSGTSFDWTVSAPDISGASNGSGTSIAQTLSQSQTSSRTATFTVTPTASGCSGSTVNSTVTVYPPITAGSIGSTQSICYNSTPAVLTNVTSATGGSGSSSYLWEQSTNGTNWNVASGTNNAATYSPPSLTASTYYRRSFSCYSTVYTSQVLISVDATTVGGAVASSIEAYGVATGSLTLAGHTGSVVRWQEKIGSADWTSIENTTTSYNYTNINSTRQYRAEVKSGVCAAAYSTAATLAIYPSPAVVVTGSTALPPGGTVLLTATEGLYSYQWLKNDVAINGATAQTYTVTHPASYKVRAKGSATAPEYTTGALVVSYAFQDPITDMNYVQTIAFNKPGITGSTDVYDLGIKDFVLSTSYFDGLGRPVQTVALGAGGEGKDIIQVNVYDKFGREAKKYLPYAGTARDGRYQPAALNQLTTFYNTAADVPHDTVPFARTVFESSPLNRPDKDFGPGQAWGPSQGNKFVLHKYLVNAHGTGSGQEKIIAWTIDGSGNPVRLTSLNSGYYLSGTLMIQSTTDEHGNEVREYTDKSGQVILKKVYAAGTPTDFNTAGNWAETYYIYDVFGQLRFVFQPELSKILAQSSTTNPTSTNLAEFAFQYGYDSHRRMISKQVPGAAIVYMVYDKRDRLVLTQDGNLRAENKWLFTKYDTLNRPVMTGTYTHGSSVNQSTMSGLVSTTRFCERDSTNGPHGYTNRVFPKSGLNVLTVTYYDSYGYIQGNWGTEYNYVNDALAYNGFNTPTANWTLITGQVTGSKVKVLDGGSTYLKSINYYDDRQRLVQTIADNYKGGKDRTTTLYDFAGKVLKTASVHVIGATTHTVLTRRAYDQAGRLTYTYHKTNSTAEVLLSLNAYNSIGQLKVKKLHRSPVGAQAAEPQADAYTTPDLFLNAYSQAVVAATNSITLQPGFSTTSPATFTARIGKNHDAVDAYNNSLPGGFAQDVDYKYNIRGWLTAINQSDVGTVISGNTEKDYFGMDLGYEAQLSGLTSSLAHNGNISAMKWAVAGNAQQAYTFGYDPMNRLLEATHLDKEGSSWLTNNGRFGEGSLTYDLNGNIKALKRKGYLTAAYMDDLSYTYTGNQLMKVEDSGNATSGFANGNTSTDDYAYDVNGNMSQDKNKGIDAGNIRYNFLNLPRSVRKSGADSLQYIYDATGRKLRQQVYGATAKITDYIQELMYENDTLKFLNHEEGRVIMTAAPEYQYHLKDHLGNVRVTFTSVPPPVESYSTNFEAGSNSNFNNYGTHNFDLVDHTDEAGTTYTKTQLLNGTGNYRVGIAKSFSVMPGDVITAGAWVKYMNLSSTANPNALINSLAAAFGVSSGSTGEALKAYNGLNTFAGTVAAGDHPGDNEGAPKAFATILLFDKDYNLIDAAWDQVTTTGAQTSPTTKQPPHDLVQATLTARSGGYAYVFLSNEHPTLVDIYFDDATFSVAPTPVVSVNDYYPFGLTFNSYARENSLENRWKFQGQEHVDDLGLNWDSFKWRNHQPDIGRFFDVDPLAEKYYYNSPYAFSENHVVAHRELEGLEKIEVIGSEFIAHQQKVETFFGSPIPFIDEVRNKNFSDAPNAPHGDYKKMNAEVESSTGEVLTKFLREEGDSRFEEFLDFYANWGEFDHFDHGLTGKDTKNGSILRGNIEGAEFSIDISINRDVMTFTTELTGGDEGKTYSLKVGDASGNSFVIGRLKTEEGQAKAGKNVISIPFTVNKNGHAVFDFKTLMRYVNEDKNESTK